MASVMKTYQQINDRIESGKAVVLRADEIIDYVMGHGALLLGQRHGTMAIFNAVGQPVSRFGADIARPEFPWNDLTGQDWDYMFY